MSYRNEQAIWNSNKLKTRKGELMLSYINPICYKNVLHMLHGQLDFHFLMIFLKNSKELESFIFFGTKSKFWRQES